MRLYTSVALALALVLGPGLAIAGDLEAGLKFYKEGNYADAARLLALSGKQGSAQAQALLGWMYLHGEGVAQDPAQAASWLRKAALQGNAGAQFNLGQLYTNGTGVTRDFKQALEWFEKAGAQGDPRAQYNAGVIYVNAQGVGQNYVEAYKWFSLAQARGNEPATKAKAFVEAKMSRKDLDEALKRTDKWTREHGQKR